MRNFGNLNLNVAGNVETTVQDGVFITSVEYFEGLGENVESSCINDFYGAMLNSTVCLSNNLNSSFVTYEVTVYNKSNNEYYLTGISYDENFYDNSGIACEIVEGLEDRVESEGSLTFKVKFSYANGIASNNILNSYVNFKFKRVYSVAYENIAYNNYPIKAYENEALSVTFDDDIANIAVWMNGAFLSSSEYSYSNKKLTVYNVTDDVRISSCVLEFRNLIVSDIFELTSMDYTFNSITFHGVPGDGIEDVIVPITDLEVGAYYELTFSETINSLDDDDTEYIDKYYYGNIVTDSSVTSTQSEVLWHTKYNGARENRSIKFKATAKTMYWRWILALCRDDILTEYKIYDISLNKIESNYPKANISQTTILTNGSYKINYKNDMRLVFSANGGAAAEKVNIPIINLEVGKQYKINFAEYNNGTFYPESDGYHYGCSVLSSASNNTYGMSTTWTCKETGWIEDQSITFTATANTMYWVWSLEDIQDGNEYNFEFYNISVEEL